MVASGTTKARAISGVDRPPSRRRVRATCAAGARAGWQQVNISRRRSSCTVSSSSLSSSWSRSAAACAWRSPGGLPPEAVEDPAARRGDDPPRGARGQAVLAPAHRGDGEGVLHPVLGQIDVTEGPDQDRDRPPVLLAEDALDLGSAHRAARPASNRRVLLEGPDLDRLAAGLGRLLGPGQCGIEIGASMTQNPPMCSLDSVKGPSVSRNSPPWSRTTVAEDAGGARRRRPRPPQSAARR